MGLAEILTEAFGVKKVFLKRKVVEYVESDGSKELRTMTIQGVEAYEKLVSAIYGLERIGVLDDANHVVEQLDDIAYGRDY